MDRQIIKRQAKALIQLRRKPILTASALFLALVLLFSYLSLRLKLPPPEQMLQLSDRFYELVMAGNYAGAYRIADSVQPSTAETIVSDLLSYLQVIVSFGFLLLLFKAARGEEVAPGILLDGFASWAKVLLVELITRLIVTLGYFALVIPGILASYNYRMAPYLLIAHPEYSVIDCLRESRLRIRGYRLDLFRLDLSFLGWGLLSLVPVLGFVTAVWALPYWRCSCLLFFDSVNEGMDPEPRPEDQDRFLF